MQSSFGVKPNLTANEIAFFERVAYLNFFRDAYKADLAIQNGATLWTHDRLLFVFHALRQKKKGGLPGIFFPSDMGKYMVSV